MRRGRPTAHGCSTSSSALTVLDYTEHTAAQHARLLAFVRRAGSPRGAHDLIIAAHAAQTGRSVVSGDAHATFGGLPGVSTMLQPERS